MADKITEAPIAELPEAEITDLLTLPDNSEALELRVNIAGQDQQIVLRLDALTNHVSSDQVVAKQLQKIAECQSSLVKLTRGLVLAIQDQSGTQAKYLDAISLYVKKLKDE